MNGSMQSQTIVEAQTETLRDEYLHQQALFNAQPLIVQRFLETQAGKLAEAFIQRTSRAQFLLPDRVITSPDAAVQPIPVPDFYRSQHIGSLWSRLSSQDVHLLLRQRLAELDQTLNPAISASASLIRYSTAMHMVHNMLPAGRHVQYTAAEAEDIPTIPEVAEEELKSAITAPTDAIVENGKAEAGRGDLLVPFVPAARKFYLPQWVAFDDHDKLLVNSISEADGHIKSMQQFMNVLFAARSLAPYIVLDAEYETKRCGMLGQLINQGRAFARWVTADIIREVKQRAEAQTLNRGLKLSLPYFDDQELKILNHNFVVIPAGRIMFVPAFVVRTALEEQAKIAQDTRFSASTRKHLLFELHTLEAAFRSPEE